MAPRVIFQYVNWDMRGEQPTTWTIDNYDGEESWNECGQEPHNVHRGDGEVNANQYQKMSGELYQWESAADDLIKKWNLQDVQNPNEDQSWRIREWQRIKDGVRATCMSMYQEIENQSKTWRHKDQSYHVEAWCAEHHNTYPDSSEFGSVACVVRGTQKKIRRKIPEPDDEASDEEEEQLVCSMPGRQWESRPFPIAIDSGACASVLPTDWCNHVHLLKTPQSEAKEYFRAANGKKTYNEGQQLVSMMTKEGAMRDMSFTVCSVTKALGSVSQLCRAGNRVIFNPPWDPEGSHIENENRGERSWLEEQGGLYVLHANVAPHDKHTSNIYGLQTGLPGG